MPAVKTEKGQQAFKDRSALTRHQRSAFIMFDGKRSAVEVLAATAGMGVTRDDLQFLFDQGFVAEGTVSLAPGGTVALAEGLDPATAPLVAGSGRSPQQRYEDAYPVATRLTAALGLRGFRLNLAVEGAGSFEQLAQLALKIRDAIGDEKFAELNRALHE
jgi:hypothetical protein